jgi:hypothetical protein
MGARQTIAVIIAFRKCNKISLEGWTGACRSRSKRNTLKNGLRLWFEEKTVTVKYNNYPRMYFSLFDFVLFDAFWEKKPLCWTHQFCDRIYFAVSRAVSIHQEIRQHLDLTFTYRLFSIRATKNAVRFSSASKYYPYLQVVVPGQCCEWHQQKGEGEKRDSGVLKREH